MMLVFLGKLDFPFEASNHCLFSDKDSVPCPSPGCHLTAVEARVSSPGSNKLVQQYSFTDVAAHLHNTT